MRAADEVDAALGRLAKAARRLRPHSQELTGERGLQVLNAAYLVAAHRSGEVTALVRSLDRPGAAVRIEVSGPWVPYSFAGEG
jgi:hypothetical protein